tara:strand:+ start:1191 stop:2102 length:912 start_codon:yes stop_codon:yes gene_type:complete
MIKVFFMNFKDFKLVNIFKITRPYQWVKNILIFIPMLMSHQLTIDNFILSIKAFIIFSLIASSIYVINDIADLESDKKHPYKKHRPLAAGLINLNQCKILIFILLLISSFFLLSTNLNFFFLIISYFIISNLYTFLFKKYIYVDLLILSMLYTLRIIAGGVITDISVSIWLLSFSVFFFISLASVKRQIEIMNLKKVNEKKISGRGYSLQNENTINKISIFSGCISILVLIFYINSPQILKLYSSPIFLWGMAFMMFFWITRIIYIAKKGKIKDDPIVYAINDKISYLCLFFILCVIWLGITI